MSMRTVIVLSALSDTTWPRRTCGEPGPCSAGGVPSPVVVFFARSCWRRRRRAAALFPRRSGRPPGGEARRRPPLPRAAARRPRGGLLGRDGGLVGRRGGLDGRLLGGGAPVRRRLVVLLVCHHLSSRIGVEAALAGDRQRASEVALGGADAGRVLELAGRQLEAEAEDLAPLGPDVLDELVVLQVAQLTGGHQTWSSRMTNF